MSLLSDGDDVEDEVHQGVGLFYFLLFSFFLLLTLENKQTSATTASYLAFSIKKLEPRLPTS